MDVKLKICISPVNIVQNQWQIEKDSQPFKCRNKKQVVKKMNSIFGQNKLKKHKNETICKAQPNFSYPAKHITPNIPSCKPYKSNVNKLQCNHRTSLELTGFKLLHWSIGFL